MEQNHWQLGRWRGVPVTMHWTVLIAAVWLYIFFWDLLATAIASAAFLALLVAHEFGHVAVLRQRKIAVEGIELNGIHGRTSHAWATAGHEILVAWGGVGVQFLVMVLALAAGSLLGPQTPPIVSLVAGPMLFVFTKLNILLMVVALLPLGPFDGHAAWKAIPWLRKRLRQRRAQARELKLFPERGLSPEKRREVEASSSQAAAALMEKLAMKSPDRKEDA